VLDRAPDHPPWRGGRVSAFDAAFAKLLWLLVILTVTVALVMTSVRLSVKCVGKIVQGVSLKNSVFNILLYLYQCDRNCTFFYYEKLLHIQCIFFASNNLMAGTQAMSARLLLKWHSMCVAWIFLRRVFTPFGIQINSAIIWKHFRPHRMHKMSTVSIDEPVVWPFLCISCGCSDTFARWCHAMRPFLNYFRHLLAISLLHTVSAVLKL